MRLPRDFLTVISHNIRGCGIRDGLFQRQPPSLRPIYRVRVINPMRQKGRAVAKLRPAAHAFHVPGGTQCTRTGVKEIAATVRAVALVEPSEVRSRGLRRRSITADPHLSPQPLEPGAHTRRPARRTRVCAINPVECIFIWLQLSPFSHRVPWSLARLGPANPTPVGFSGATDRF